MFGESIARADRAVRSRHSGQAVRPSLGAVQYRDNLNEVTFGPIGDNIRRVWDDEVARIGHATRSAAGRDAAKRVTAARIRSIIRFAAVGLSAAMRSRMSSSRRK